MVRCSLANRNVLGLVSVERWDELLVCMINVELNEVSQVLHARWNLHEAGDVVVDIDLDK